MQKVEVIIIGAGAAGLMCAIEAGKRHRQALVLEHTNKAGKKILMSGGGRCNFTNYNITAENYISHNPHFCKSALSGYSQWDFIDLVNRHHIPFHEKKQGQLFCDNKSKDILEMLLAECEINNVTIRLNTKIENINQIDDYHFMVKTNQGNFHCQSLVIASGGLSMPSMGSSPFGYKIAEQFGIKVWPTRAGLVPLTLHNTDKEKLSALSGIAVPSVVSTMQQSFRDNILFTHRGISGPAILQISSYWHPGEKIIINLLPEINLMAQLNIHKHQQPQKQLKTIMSDYLPKRLIETFLTFELAEKKLLALPQSELAQVAKQFTTWVLSPNATEGYRTAEVTLGGVDCDALSSKTMTVKQVKGLYFIGEAVDVTGWLGGFNFQWAWSSGWAAGQVV
jgi:predicted Rossmann fold flavoprotein